MKKKILVLLIIMGMVLSIILGGCGMTKQLKQQFQQLGGQQQSEQGGQQQGEQGGGKGD